MKGGFALTNLLTLCLPLLIVSMAVGQEDSLSVGDLKRMSLEELMQIEVTTVSKRGESLMNTPAAIHVITQEDIRRSGALTLPEALRLAPNLNVAQVTSQDWAISARGFNGTVSNKLLVLIDGRVVYTPLYSGVFWDVQNVFLEDIERIEVISGPGGTLWGANAVNGIINIITQKSSAPTSQGVHIHAGVGTEDYWLAGVRYGGRLGEDWWFRVYGMGFSKKETRLPDGRGATDDWTINQAGFRLDREFESADLSLQGDFYLGNINQPVPDDIALRGGNMMGRYAHRIGDRSVVEIRAYADVTHRRIPGTFGQDLGTFDIEGQHTIALDRHDIVWGIGFRYFNDRIVNSASLAFLPARLQSSLVTFFLEDAIILIPQTLRLTFGSKFERNHYTGFEFQPTARLSWNIESNQFLWAAVSRAVRTPSRIDRDFHIPGNPPYVLSGGPDFKSETLMAYEIGYRVSLTDLTLDVATFYNLYDNLRSLEPGVLGNGLEALSYGAEFAVDYNLSQWWRLRTGYSLFHKLIALKEWSRDVSNGQSEGNDARHRLQIHSFMDLPWNLQLDLWMRYVDRLPNANAVVPGFVTLDARLGIRITDRISLSIVGQHLLQKSHPEFGAPSTRSELQRGVVVKTGISL